MTSSDTPSTNNNEGIVATTVNADVLAVGRNASAVKYQLNDAAKAQIDGQLNQLLELLQQSHLDAQSIKLLSKDLDGIKTELNKSQPEQSNIIKIIAGFVEKLQLAKNVLSNTGEIIKHTKNIAGLLKIPLSLVF